MTVRPPVGPAPPARPAAPAAGRARPPAGGDPESTPDAHPPEAGPVGLAGTGDTLPLEARGAPALEPSGPTGLVSGSVGKVVSVTSDPDRAADAVSDIIPTIGTPGSDSGLSAAAADAPATCGAN